MFFFSINLSLKLVIKDGH